MKKLSVFILGIIMFSIGSCRPSNEAEEVQNLLEIKNSKASEDFHTSVIISCEVDNPVAVLPIIENKVFELNGHVINSELEVFKTDEKTERISNDSVLVSYFKNVKNYYHLMVPKKEVNNFLATLHPLVLKIDKRSISNTEINRTINSNSSKSESQNLEASRVNSNNQTSLKSDMVSLNLEIGQNPKFMEDRVQMPLISNNKANLSYRLKEPVVYGFNLLVEIIIFLLHIWPLYLIIFLIHFSIKFYKSKASKTV